MLEIYLRSKVYVTCFLEKRVAALKPEFSVIHLEFIEHQLEIWSAFWYCFRGKLTKSLEQSPSSHKVSEDEFCWLASSCRRQTLCLNHSSSSSCVLQLLHKSKVNLTVLKLRKLSSIKAFLVSRWLILAISAFLCYEKLHKMVKLFG